MVDANLKVWGTENLYVAGSSVFPSGMTVPPTLILTALSQRLGRLFETEKRELNSFRCFYANHFTLLEK